MASFHEALSEYLARIQCTSKDLSLTSGLSPVVISRYRSGDRTPIKNSPQFQQLVSGLAVLCTEAGLTDTETDIKETLEATLPRYDTRIPPALFRERLVKLVEVTHIPMSHMARALSYDPSYLSKICSGLRFPSAPSVFLNKLCEFVARRFQAPKEQKELAALLGFEFTPAGDDSFAEALVQWFDSIDE